MVETAAPTAIVGGSLARSAVRSRYGITVVGIERVGQPFTCATEHTVIEPGDLLIVSGSVRRVESFADSVRVGVAVGRGCGPPPALCRPFLLLPVGTLRPQHVGRVRVRKSLGVGPP